LSAVLYTPEILRLAVASAGYPRLDHPDVTVERRSKTCGSTIIVDLTLADDGRVVGYGHEVRACALGQAAAAVFARQIIGRDAAALSAARETLAAWLDGTGAMPDWPGIETLAAALGYPARHGSMRMVFEAAAEASEQARSKVTAR